MNIISTNIGYECPILKVEERLVEIRGEKEIQYVVVRQPNVTVLAKGDDGRLLFIKEKRGKHGEFRIELPSGKLHEYEVSEDTAKIQALSELQEETGYKANKISLLRKYDSISNWLERTYYLFVAWDLELSPVEIETTEEIELYEVSFEEARILLKEEDFYPQERYLIEEGMNFFEEKERKFFD